MLKEFFKDREEEVKQQQEQRAKEMKTREHMQEIRQIMSNTTVIDKTAISPRLLSSQEASRKNSARLSSQASVIVHLKSSLK